VRVLAGTSGYSYAPWKGNFYPEKLPAAKMLGYYSERLPAVEINNTFYKLPAAEAVQKWAAETREGFAFALKSPRRITHDRRLVVSDVGETARRFWETATALGTKLGPLLFQLPPFMKKDVPRLEAFLADLRSFAPAARPALEFRHPSWFADDVYQTLRTAEAALCIADVEELATPFEATAGWGYLRLRRQDYDDAAVAAWAEKIAAQGERWSEAHVFFKHEDEGRGPALAARLLEAFRTPPAQPGVTV
jgi:uncharacterized protein YecE (DUF72 family)